MVFTPPYLSPQPSVGAFHWLEHALKIPTPPPGIAMSKWFFDKSLPVLVTWTSSFLFFSFASEKVSTKQVQHLETSAPPPEAKEAATNAKVKVSLYTCGSWSVHM